MIIFDCESDGLLDEATKIWIYGWTHDGKEFHTTTDPNEFYGVLDTEYHAGCHNSFRFDFPLFKKIHGYTYRGIKIDTLFLSWYLYPNRPKHGLGSFGPNFGFEKVAVGDDAWKTGDIDLMRSRVIEDVKINWALWSKQKKDLEALYGKD